MSFNTDTFMPPLLATGTSQGVNGRQQLGSGLVTHRGIIDANKVRATGALSPQHGAGLELEYAQPIKTGVLLSYDRDSSAYTDLQINAKNITLTATGGKVTLPAGTAQSPVVGYRAVVGWGNPLVNVWNETPAQVTITTTLANASVRLEACGTVSHSVATAVVYIGAMIDGTAVGDSLCCAQPTTAGALVPFAFIFYYTIATPAAHRFSIMMFSGSSGASLWNGAYTNLWVTEQRA